MEWISVKDRLPEIGVDVLTCEVTQHYTAYEVMDWDGDYWHNEYGHDPTHWQPLPEPPKPAGTKRWKCEGCGAKWASDTPPFNGNHLIMIEHPGPECGPVVEDAETPK